MNIHNQKIELLKEQLPNMNFEVFEDGLLVLNPLTKMGVKIHLQDLELPIKHIIHYINAKNLPNKLTIL